MNTDLEVKYNILRGDYYRLCKKMDYYESGKAFESLKAKYEKEISRLSNKLSMSEVSYKKLSEKNNKNIAENNRLRKVISEKDSALQDAINEYEGMVDEYKNLIDELRKEIDELKGTIKKLNAQLNRVYTNSSIPSSKNENHKKIANSREKSGRLLRQCKIKINAVITFRSSDSASAYCDVLSIIKTADQQGINTYSMMKKGFSESL